MEECQEQNSRPPWSPFGQVNGPNSAQKAPGLQVSQLSHLLQQNGSSTLVRHPIPPDMRKDPSTHTMYAENFDLQQKHVDYGK